MTVEPRRGVVKLVVASADGRRVLARPNGVAGWTLPVIAVATPLREWGPEAAASARAVLGSPVEPIGPLGDEAWIVTATERIPAAGNTWISADEAARVGADAALVRRWAAGNPDVESPQS